MKITKKIVEQGLVGLFLGILGFMIVDSVFDNAYSTLGDTERFLKLMFGMIGMLSVYAIFGAIVVGAVLSAMSDMRSERVN